MGTSARKIVVVFIIVITIIYNFIINIIISIILQSGQMDNVVVTNAPAWTWVRFSLMHWRQPSGGHSGQSCALWIWQAIHWGAE